MAAESEIQSAIRALSRGPVRLFRNQSGFCECRGRKIAYGIPGKGGSDLIGWKTVIITPDMVGKHLAVFLGIEVKKPGGRVSPAQGIWMRAVKNAGGIAGVAHSTEEAAKIINQL